MEHVSLGFSTACGKSIHFTAEVVSLAVCVGDVTCEDCKKTTEYKEWKRSRDAEFGLVSQPSSQR